VDNLFAGTTTVTTVGSDIQVTYCNPDRANQTVTLTFDDGNENSTTKTVTLDANGCVTFEWSVPDWITVQINGPDSLQHSIAVGSGSDD
jgi:hypothetical protein